MLAGEGLSYKNDGMLVVSLWGGGGGGGGVGGVIAYFDLT